MNTRNQGSGVLDQYFKKTAEVDSDKEPLPAGYLLDSRIGMVVPQSTQFDFADYMMKVRRDQFQRNLYSPDYLDLLIKFTQSSQFEAIKRVWPMDSAGEPLAKDAPPRVEEVMEHSQPNVPEIPQVKPLESAYEMPSPDDISDALEILSRIMSDRPEYAKPRAGRVRVFTAAGAARLLQNIGDDSERTQRAWRIVKDMSIKNGFRHKLRFSANVEHSLYQLKLDFPNFAHVVEHVIRLMRTWPLKKEEVQRIHPVLLSGPAGTGKSTFAKALAKALQTSYNYVNLAGTSMAGVLIGSTQKWSNGQAGMVLQDLARGGAASPLFLLDEIDKISSFREMPVEGALLAMLEPQTAKTLKDEFGDCQFDASRVIYIATCNDSSLLSAPLKSRFRTFWIKKPCKDQRKVIIQNMIRQNYRKLTLSESAIELIARQDGDLREVRGLLELVVANHVEALSRQRSGRINSALKAPQTIDEHTVMSTLAGLGMNKELLRSFSF